MTLRNATFLNSTPEASEARCVLNPRSERGPEFQVFGVADVIVIDHENTECCTILCDNRATDV